MKVLIVDDEVEQKVGQFKTLMEQAGIGVLVAGTLEEAEEIFKTQQNEIDTIILDFNFPTSEENSRFDDSDGTPNGIVFLRGNKFMMRQKCIPIVINTALEEEEREKWLQKVGYSRYSKEILYKCSTKQPLSEVNEAQAKVIIDQIIKAAKNREKMKQVQESKPIKRPGCSFTWDENGNGFYNHEGD